MKGMRRPLFLYMIGKLIVCCIAILGTILGTSAGEALLALRARMVKKLIQPCGI
jgi:hypothetical protein